jgi:hypothetical protein
MNDDTRIIRRKAIEETKIPTAATVLPDDPDKTRVVARATPPALPVRKEAVVDDERTRVHRGGSEAAAGEGLTEHTSPVVGWLVVMEGPGRGQSLPLGYGMNHIGRSATNRLILDFGDEEVSRKTHTTLTHDPRGRKFYIQPGPDATNLTYLGPEPDWKPVLTPVEIFGGEMILLGRTKLKFVAFCGPDFTWD